MSTHPKVSFAVIAYKQEEFIADAVRSALEQTGLPMEIVLSDDCSPDRTFEVMKATVEGYKGPHTVILNRNPQNLGLSRHVNRIWELTTGDFVIVQAGDDISVPHRADTLVKRWLAKGRQKDLVCSYFGEIDSSGKPTGFVKKTTVFVPDLNRPVTEWKCGATGACASYTRKLYERYGPLDPQVISEDWVFSFRAWLEGGIDLVEEPLVLHRTHDESISVMARNVSKMKSREQRYAMRRKVQAGSVGIVREWAKAWKIARGQEDAVRLKELEKLCQLREAQLKAFNASPIKVGSAVFEVLRLGGVGAALKLLLRHGLRIY